MTGHGGNIAELAQKCGCEPEELFDFSANINPLGPPQWLRRVISGAIEQLVHYPEPASIRVTTAVAEHYGILAENIVVGNGTSELLFALPAALNVTRAIIPVPSYIDYATACQRAGMEIKTFPLLESDEFILDVARLGGELRTGDLVIIGSPNNPTGKIADRESLLKLCRQRDDVTFLIDEAFAGFITDYQSLACAADNIIVLCSLTKLYAIPGLRLGFLAASQEVCSKVGEYIAPWSVNSLAQAVGEKLFGDSEYVDASRKYITDHLPDFLADLRETCGLRVFDSSVNFVFAKLQNGGMDGEELAARLLRDYRVAIRVCGNYDGLDSSYIRMALRTTRENEQLLTGLADILGRRSSVSPRKTVSKQTPAIMFQGTGSDVGKSVLAAGLCRVLLQDGIRVAPFKAQNMSLNSYVTRDGGEMGRAQVVQAQACRLDPDVLMNPVLLKPSSDVGSQIIVRGKPVGNMKVADYVRYKPQAWSEVCRAYDELAVEYEVVVLEGAGSPGEVNLKSHDIVNMRMAEYARSPVVLVGDIDRGGVYASFVGHWEVMAPWERSLLAGFLVNRFRGDASLLGDAHEYLLDYTGKPVLGVVPYLKDLGLPQEDSVGFKAGVYEAPPPTIPHVEIALIDLPHISNFTDVEPFIHEPDVALRIVRTSEELGRPDAVILPGSKNVLADFSYLEQSGLASKIRELAGAGVEIIGICGGFQMLGRRVSDPHGVENESGGEMTALGLLPIETELDREKTLTAKNGIHPESGCVVVGYEIHHGISKGAPNSLFQFDDGTVCGCRAENGIVWGSYLHGMFDGDDFRRSVIEKLRLRKGLSPYSGPITRFDAEPALDRLAEVVRNTVDMDAIYAVLNL
ncbi:MAG: cobyric acid synthase [Desulfobulbaceae bacterium]|nr:cobyric acid synthase [Desulfobulbaceae bacterium]